MPRAPKRIGGGTQRVDRTHKPHPKVKPIRIHIAPTTMKMIPLVPQYMVRYEQEQERQRCAEDFGLVEVEPKRIVSIRFADVRVGKRISSLTAGMRKNMELRFVPVTWNSESVVPLKFTDLTPTNSCFTFV
ncbi:uncharacterized protein TM35_001131020 [Trypanosoma theileri]|uniref:Uncharacterized protein n=1 Tax=Trypanosoma theileri TaxID=67003 RepID=A0A1X0NDY2_9TRYP|nr:uncharacterized protein TM35_001131020 [Trypanosoma theileri]ORC81576.1 hypothetical protein TM35_001131020 [Trypanosoma theileri]